MQTFQEIYEREVVLLSPADRLRLASLILQDVTQFPAPLVDTSLVDDATEWSDEDLREWSLHSHAQQHGVETRASNAKPTFVG